MYCNKKNMKSAGAKCETWEVRVRPEFVDCQHSVRVVYLVASLSLENKPHYEYFIVLCLI